MLTSQGGDGSRGLNPQLKSFTARLPVEGLGRLLRELQLSVPTRMDRGGTD